MLILSFEFSLKVRAADLSSFEPALVFLVKHDEVSWIRVSDGTHSVDVRLCKVARKRFNQLLHCLKDKHSDLVWSIYIYTERREKSIELSQTSDVKLLRRLTAVSNRDGSCDWIASRYLTIDYCRMGQRRCIFRPRTYV